MKNSYCLCTTGLSELWDMRCNLLILGPWCLTDENNRKLLEGRDYIEIPSPIETATVKDAADYCYWVYVKLIPVLSGALNNIHGVEYPEKYWRVLLGPWLLHFVGVLYDRYKRIEKTIEVFPDFQTAVLPAEGCSTVCADTYDFLAGKVGEDYYNLRLFSIVTRYLCPEKITVSHLPYMPQMLKPEPRWKEKFRKWLKLGLFTRLKGKSIILSDMYHLSLIDQIKMGLDQRFQMIGFINVDQERRDSMNDFNSEARKAMVLSGAADRFQSLLYSVLPQSIPISFIENYHFHKAQAEAFYKSDIRAVGSAVGWYFNESLKFYIGELVLKDITLMDFQHGGGYGGGRSVPTESISLEKDIFFTWGWKSTTNTHPLPSPHLSKLKDSYSCKTDGLLFVGTGIPRYPYRFDTSLKADDMPAYLDKKKRFIHHIKPGIRPYILYRPGSDYGWGEVEALKKEFPGINISTAGRLVQLMKKARLVVIDHPHTSYLEALIINVPTIFFWDHDVYLMRPEAEEFYCLLREAGILFRDPESTARKVNEVFENPLAWWEQSEVQEAREKFCRRFALNSDNWKRDWSKAFKEVLKSGDR